MHACSHAQGSLCKPRYTHTQPPTVRYAGTPTHSPTHPHPIVESSWSFSRKFDSFNRWMIDLDECDLMWPLWSHSMNIPSCGIILICLSSFYPLILYRCSRLLPSFSCVVVFSAQLVFVVLRKTKPVRHWAMWGCRGWRQMGIWHWGQWERWPLLQWNRDYPTETWHGGDRILHEFKNTLSGDLPHTAGWAWDYGYCLSKCKNHSSE